MLSSVGAVAKSSVRNYATVAPKSVDWKSVQIPLRFTGVKGNLAKALLISAHDNGITDIVRKDLLSIQNNYPDQKFRARLNVAAQKPDCPSLKDEFSHPTRILLHELYNRRILKDAPNVARAFDSLVKIVNNEIEATVTAAKPEDLTNIEQQIKKSLAAAGKTGNVVLTTKVDPSIIGGYVIEFDDFYGDFSLRSFAGEYFQQKEKRTASQAAVKRAALLKELNSQPHSDTILRGKLKSFEEGFYAKYQHLATDQDIIVEEVPQRVEEVERTPKSLVDTYLHVQTFTP